MKKAIVEILEVINPHSCTESEAGRLDRNQVLRLRNKAGRRLTCVAGQLWVTKKGDPSDYILVEGESLALEGDSLVGALREGEFSLAC